MSDTSGRIYEFGAFRVDGMRRLLLREGEPVRLTAKAFDILLLLIEGKGRLVEKDELMRRVWPDAVVEENNLTVNISALRKALGESPGDRRYLVTVPGRGYQFVAEVREREAEPPARVEALPAPPPVEGDPRRLRRRVAPVLALVAAAIVAAYFLRSRADPGDRVGSIAVLPFANASGNPELEYLSDGISESLISRLSQLPGLKVIARDSAFRFKGTGADLSEAARALGVRAFVTGRVAQRGESLAISVELVDATDRTLIWAEQYQRKATDLLAVQSEISREIADNLRLRLSAGDRRLLARTEAVNPQAYELLLRGRFQWSKGNNETRRKAVEYYDRAVAVDPNYAPAYAELANAYSILGNDGVMDAKEAVGRAEAAARRALELDEGLAAAHRALAYTRELAWDWAGAEREYKRAVEAGPNDAEAHAGYARFLGLLGRHEEAAAEAKRGKELDPISLRIDLWVFSTLMIARRYDEALAIVAEMRELDPNHPLTELYAGYSYAVMGRYPEVIALFEGRMNAGSATMDSDEQIYLGYAYARVGRGADAKAILRRLERGPGYVSPAGLAILHAALGETDQAFARLERAYAAHDVQLQYLGSDALYDGLRGDPRFADLVRRVGLPP